MFRYTYCLVIGMFNGQFRLHENLMYEKKLAKVNFAESLQWPIYHYLLCNKKIVGYYNYMVTNQLFDKLGIPVYSEHAIAAYFAYFPHIFCAYFKLDRSAYLGKKSPEHMKISRRNAITML